MRQTDRQIAKQSERQIDMQRDRGPHKQKSLESGRQTDGPINWQSEARGCVLFSRQSAEVLRQAALVLEIEDTGAV